MCYWEVARARAVGFRTTAYGFPCLRGHQLGSPLFSTSRIFQGFLLCFCPLAFCTWRVTPETATKRLSSKAKYKGSWTDQSRILLCGLHPSPSTINQEPSSHLWKHFELELHPVGENRNPAKRMQRLWTAYRFSSLSSQFRFRPRKCQLKG